ncbi:MAG: mechanosensitive ion channel domain-containing protein [Parvibaculum sp.]|uniref:mechanosensitive ion channel family protein n=1 Tax=Parvibaculum sp. TaxID=2024848 RepID=UPI0034A03C45
MSERQFAPFYEAFGWMPVWSTTVLLLTLALAAAVAIHWIALRLLTAAFSRRAVYVQTVLRRTRMLTRAVVVFVFATFVVQAAPLAARDLSILSAILTVCLIIIVGWTAMMATHIASDVYVSRFRIDVADNLLARKHVTQIRILRRVAITLIAMLTTGTVLMSFESVQQYGVSIFASAGAAGLVLGFAARPVLENLIAGIQIAVTQPIRIDDAVVIEGEWGWIEEITGTYVVIRIWDWRRLIVPLSYFIQNPFTNWTRESASIIGTVFLHADYTLPVDEMRGHLIKIVRELPLWDGNVANVQVTDATARTIEIRALVSARTSSQAWDLRCEVREKLVAYLREMHPESLPQVRSASMNPTLERDEDGIDGIVADGH